MSSILPSLTLTRITKRTLSVPPQRSLTPYAWYVMASSAAGNGSSSATLVELHGCIMDYACRHRLLDVIHGENVQRVTVSECTLNFHGKYVCVVARIRVPQQQLTNNYK